MKHDDRIEETNVQSYSECTDPTEGFLKRVAIRSLTRIFLKANLIVGKEKIAYLLALLHNCGNWALILYIYL